MAQRIRRTKKAYTDLHDTPGALFDGVETILFPNSEREIWFRAGNQSVSLRAHAGPFGLGLEIKTHVGASEGGMTVRNYSPEYQTLPAADGVRETSITCYKSDPKSQAFKRWYVGQETTEDLDVLGDEYRRQPGYAHTVAPTENAK